MFRLRLRQRGSYFRIAGLLTLCACQFAFAQQPVNWTAEQDHQNMMDQLGIQALRPGPSGSEKALNHANYDEAKANRYGDLPDALTLKSGKRSHRRNNGGNDAGRKLSKISKARCLAAFHPTCPQ